MTDGLLIRRAWVRAPLSPPEGSAFQAISDADGTPREATKSTGSHPVWFTDGSRTDGSASGDAGGSGLPRALPIPASGGVYFLMAVSPRGDVAVKIGWAKNFGDRLAWLKTAHPWPLRLVDFIARGSVQTETAMHRRFNESRIWSPGPRLLRGDEWFRFEGALRSFIIERRGLEKAGSRVQVDQRPPDGEAAMARMLRRLKSVVDEANARDRKRSLAPRKRGAP